MLKKHTNIWGGEWTQKKINIVVEYARAYLTVMSKHKYWKLMYFDGFAGDGSIQYDQEGNNIRNVAVLEVLKISNPRSFDMYYFVEKIKRNAKKLEEQVKNDFPKKQVFVVSEDCNEKLNRLSSFLKSDGKMYKVLAFIDPYGMQVKWESIKTLKDLPIDLWILVPTGLGVNRLLKKNGDISDQWLTKLRMFLGMTDEQIKSAFYRLERRLTLFGDDDIIVKEQDAIDKAGDLYKERLNSVFKFVSKPFLLKNKTGTVMYHFFLASNNKTAQNIADDIIKTKLK